MGTEAKHYYMGYAEALLYMQADLDTKENAEKGRRPVLTGRLPNTFYLMEKDKWVDTPFVVDNFRAVIRELDEDGRCVRMRITENSPNEPTFELAHTEGYLGVPDDLEGAVV